MYKEFVCHKDGNIRGVTSFLGIMMTISSNTAICERGFSWINRKMSVLQIKLGEDTMDQTMRINIDGPLCGSFQGAVSFAEHLQLLIKSFMK